VFEHYTEKARRAIFFARYEAGQYGTPSIESWHILLAVFRVEDQLASAFIRSVNERATIRSEIESQIKIGERISTRVEIPFSAESKLILTHADREAGQMKHQQVGTGHLLLGLLNETQSVAAGILANHNVDTATVRKAVASSPP
jgi:ATP-dependent Clp protease ATP-binding subunit ClpC